MQTAPLLDLTHLRLFTQGDEDIEKTMLIEIIRELKTETTKIPGVIAAQDWYGLSRATHKLKTTLPFIGNTKLIELNTLIEQASRTLTNLEHIPAWSEEFLSHLPQVVAELENLLQD